MSRKARLNQRLRREEVTVKEAFRRLVQVSDDLQNILRFDVEYGIYFTIEREFLIFSRLRSTIEWKYFKILFHEWNKLHIPPQNIDFLFVKDIIFIQWIKPGISRLNM